MYIISIKEEIMKKLVVFTEENPNADTILRAIKKKNCNVLYSNNPRIEPMFDSEGRFLREYRLTNVSVDGISDIYIVLMRGVTKIVDYLIFKMDMPNREFPSKEDIHNGELLVALEDTKTLPHESRNTSFYQRIGKFIILRMFYPDAFSIMNYNDECERVAKKFPKTAVFGYRLYLTVGINFMGLDFYKMSEKEFISLMELFANKNEILNGNRNYHNVPLRVDEDENTIYLSVSLRCSTGKSHIPNNGYLIGMIYAIRKIFKDNRSIVIRNHGLTQEIINKAISKSNTSAIYYYSREDLGDYTFEGIDLDRNAIKVPTEYFYIDTESEKHVDILLEKVLLLADPRNNIVRYANHGGTEKTYYKNDLYGRGVPLTKESNGLPDLDIINTDEKVGLVIESKKWSTRKKGYEEIEKYDSYKKRVNADYPDYKNTFWVTLNGGSAKRLQKEMLTHDNILMGLSKEGDIFLSKNAPNFMKKAFDSYKVTYV